MSWTTIHDLPGTSKELSGKAVSDRASGNWGYKVQACNASGCGQSSGPVSLGMSPG